MGGRETATIAAVPATSTVVDEYLELLARTITGRSLGPVAVYNAVDPDQRRLGALWRILSRTVARRGVALVEASVYDPTTNNVGDSGVYDLPPTVFTMVGEARLENLRRCVVDVVERGVPGDLIETGVWRGGSTIFMRGILKAYDVVDRQVVVADSFQGLPPPDAEKYPSDAGLDWHVHEPLAVAVDSVRENFRRFGLLDDQVEFLEGWFKDTLPTIADRRFALLRLDGDLYESTMDALTNLYPSLSTGGYVIVDDYSIPACRAAVADYRSANGVEDPIEEIDWTGVYWRKSR